MKRDPEKDRRQFDSLLQNREAEKLASFLEETRPDLTHLDAYLEAAENEGSPEISSLLLSWKEKTYSTEEISAHEDELLQKLLGFLSPDETDWAELYDWHEEKDGLCLDVCRCHDAYLGIPEEIGSEKVVSLGDGLFRNDKTLIQVLMPASLKRIGQECFLGCPSLTAVTMNEGLISIGRRAFCGCTSLKSLTWPTGLRNVGADAFALCFDLEDIHLLSERETSDIIFENDASDPALFALRKLCGGKSLPTHPELMTASSLRAGDRIFFGSLPQGSEDKKKPILWDVLEENDGVLTLISHFALTARRFHNDSMEILWEMSSVRAYLNDGFIREAFTREEAGRITESDLENPPNRSYPGPEGHLTRDLVYLPSGDEYRSYFKIREERIPRATWRTKREGAYVSEDGRCRIYLRTSGYALDSASIVDDTGLINDAGDAVSDGSNAIRPMLRVRL